MLHYVWMSLRRRPNTWMLATGAVLLVLPVAQFVLIKELPRFTRGHEFVLRDYHTVRVAVRSMWTAGTVLIAAALLRLAITAARRLR